MQGSKLIKVLIGSAAVALFFTLLGIGLSLAGVINITAARLFFALAAFVAIGGIAVSDLVCSKPRKHIIAITSVAALIVAAGFLLLDHWIVGKKADEQANLNVPRIATPALPPATSVAAVEKPQASSGASKIPRKGHSTHLTPKYIPGRTPTAVSVSPASQPPGNTTETYGTDDHVKVQVHHVGIKDQVSATVHRASSAAVPAATPQIIQNAPQGINIGGDNNGTATVNNFGPPERHLTPAQITALDQVAASLPDDMAEWLSLDTENDFESQAYGKEIYKIFANHKKIASGPTIRLVERAPWPKGVCILIQSDKDRNFLLAQTIGTALMHAGITPIYFQGAADLKPGMIKIVVGERE